MFSYSNITAYKSLYNKNRKSGFEIHIYQFLFLYMATNPYSVAKLKNINKNKQHHEKNYVHYYDVNVYVMLFW